MLSHLTNKRKLLAVTVALPTLFGRGFHGQNNDSKTSHGQNNDSKTSKRVKKRGKNK
jgi:hypothetical protein